MPGTTFSAANWTGYDEQSLSNPTSSLTDFTLLIDVSDLSSTWKSSVQSDGGDIRLTKGDGTTELAYDLIGWNYNGGDPTGLIRVLWSGSMASSGTQNVRVWAGYTGGTAVAYDPSETYGSDNAYASSITAYYPEGSGTDRTSNSNDTSDTGTLSTVTGKIGNATDYENSDGSSSPSEYADTGIAGSGSIKAIITWARFDALSGDNGLGVAGASGQRFHWEAVSFGAVRFYYGSTQGQSANGIVGSSNWHHIAMTDAAGWVDGSQRATYSSSYSGTASRNVLLGTTPNGTSSFQNSMNGKLGQVFILNSRPSNAWIAQEYDQTNDNATFWGTWAWTTNTPPIGHGGATDCYNKLMGLATHSEDANLEIWLPCQDNAGSTVNDQSSNEIDGSVVGGDTTADITTTGPNSWLTRSLELDGSVDRIDVDGATGEGFSAESGGHDLTVLARVYLDSIAGSSGTLGDSQMIVQKGPPAVSDFEWSLGTEGNKVWFRTNGGNTGGTSPTVSATTWLDIAARWDNGTNVTLHVDGSSNTVAVTDTSENNFNWGLVLGDIYYADNPYDGRIADFSIFSRLISTDEYDDWRAGPEPENTAAPTISGTETEDEELTCDPGTWALPAPFSAGSNGTISYSYQWTRSDDDSGTNEANISGATSSTYTLVTADVGKYLRCYVRGANDGGYDLAEDTASAFTGAIVEAGGDPNSGSGTVEAIATAVGAGRTTHKGAGQSGTTAAAIGAGRVVRRGTGLAEAIANATGKGYIARRGEGFAESVASTTGKGYTAKQGLGISQGTTSATGKGYTARRSAGIGQAIAAAQGKGYVMRRGSGAAAVVANASGFGIQPGVTPTPSAVGRTRLKSRLSSRLRTRI